MATVSLNHDPDEKVDIPTLIAEVVKDPETWLDRPNDLLGGKRPRELLGTDSEERVRELVRSIKIGMFS